MQIFKISESVNFSDLCGIYTTYHISLFGLTGISWHFACGIKSEKRFTPEEGQNI